MAKTDVDKYLQSINTTLAYCMEHSHLIVEATDMSLITEADVLLGKVSDRVMDRWIMAEHQKDESSSPPTNVFQIRPKE